jgi:hypothetical protein
MRCDIGDREQNPSIARTYPHAHERHPDVDPVTGRIRPISTEEWRVRQAALTVRLTEIDAQDETPDALYDEFMRNLDEERRRQGRPAAFEGYY